MKIHRLQRLPLLAYPGLQRQRQRLRQHKSAARARAFKQKIPRLLRLGFVDQPLLTTRPEGGDVARVARRARQLQLLAGAGQFVGVPQIVLIGQGHVVKPGHVHIAQQPEKIGRCAAKNLPPRQHRHPCVALRQLRRPGLGAIAGAVDAEHHLHGHGLLGQDTVDLCCDPAGAVVRGQQHHDLGSFLYNHAHQPCACCCIRTSSRRRKNFRRTYRCRPWQASADKLPSRRKRSRLSNSARCMASM